MKPIVTVSDATASWVLVNQDSIALIRLVYNGQWHNVIVSRRPLLM